MTRLKKHASAAAALALVATIALGASGCVPAQAPITQSSNESASEPIEQACQATEAEVAEECTSEAMQEEAVELHETTASQEQSQGNPPSSSSNKENFSLSAPKHEAKQVWIVDVPAHTQVIHHDATGHQESSSVYTLCTICGSEITGSPMAHMDAAHPTAATGSWTSAVRPGKWVEDSPAWDETVQVPEKGHYEWR